MTGRIATDIATFVDNMMGIGGNNKECTRFMYRIATVVNYLGEQNVSRKIREVSQSLWMWTSVPMKTDNRITYLSTSVKKWMKDKVILEAWWSVYANDTQSLQPNFGHKDMQRKRGFLVHINVIYP